MIEYKNVDLSQLLSKVTSQEAQLPSRFRLPYPQEQVMELLVAFYKIEVEKRTTEFQPLGDDMKGKMTAISQWLTAEKKKVGLLLYGSVGTGKTTLLNALCCLVNATCLPERLDSGRRAPTLSGMPSRIISVYRAKQIMEIYSNDRDTYNKMCKVDLLAIDELGVEAVESKYYGNVSEPLIDLLSMRYDRQLCTFVSTNLNKDDILKRYGDRIADRFAEMFAKIPFTQRSYRQ